MKQKKSEAKEMFTEITKEDIDNLKKENKALDEEWSVLEENGLYQKDESKEQKIEAAVPQVIVKSDKRKKQYFWQALGAAALFAAGVLTGVVTKTYETELKHCGNNTLTRITDAAYAIAGKTPESRLPEVQKKGLAEQIEYLETTLPNEEFANFKKDLEAVLEKYSKINGNIKY